MIAKRVVSFAATALLAAGCARPASTFERHLAAERWAEAATAFAADSAALLDPDLLLAAAGLHASPGRDTWDPERAVSLLELFAERFPAHRRHDEALTRLVLVKEIARLRAELRELKAIDLGRTPPD